MKSPDHLDLLESVLTYSLWPEPPRPVAIAQRKDVVARCAKLVDRLLRRWNLSLHVNVPHVDVEAGRGYPVYAHTMIGRLRMRNIRILCNNIVTDNVPGAFVECGVWRGGASIYARACLPPERLVVCCDSFDGFPADSTDPECASNEFVKVGLDTVRNSFRAFNLDYNVKFIKGFFADTLPNWSDGPIAVLRADGDMYNSTMQILANLYRYVSSGGYIIIDDYGDVPSCRHAVDIFRQIEKIDAPLISIDHTGVYWKKL